MDNNSRSELSIEVTGNEDETMLPLNEMNGTDSSIEDDNDSWDFFFDGSDDNQDDDDVRASPVSMSQSSRSLLEQCPLDPIPEDSPYDDTTNSPLPSPITSTTTTALSRHLQSSRLAILALIALALTALTAQTTFSSRKRTLVVKGVHLTRGGLHDVPRTFTNARGQDFTLPRGVPLPPPLLSSLCASHGEGEECGNYSTADCSWCGTIDRCVPSAFSPSFCKKEKAML